jgi:hypothetical protein
MQPKEAASRHNQPPAALGACVATLSVAALPTSAELSGY